MKKFEQFQKKCIKRILFEAVLSYSDPSTYVCKCRQANIPPLALRFKVIDLVLLFKIIHGFILVTLPTIFPGFMERANYLWYVLLSSISRPLENSFSE